MCFKVHATDESQVSFSDELDSIPCTDLSFWSSKFFQSLSLTVATRRPFFCKIRRLTGFSENYKHLQTMLNYHCANSCSLQLAMSSATSCQQTSCGSTMSCAFSGRQQNQSGLRPLPEQASGSSKWSFCTRFRVNQHLTKHGPRLLWLQWNLESCVDCAFISKQTH